MTIPYLAPVDDMLFTMVHLIGGARVAAELDAVRATEDGFHLAYEF